MLEDPFATERIERDYARRCGYEVYGRDGRTLGEHWRDGMFDGMDCAGAAD